MCQQELRVLAMRYMMERRVETISFYRKRLLHWSVRDALYFVTIRQKNSIPADATMKIRADALPWPRMSAQVFGTGRRQTNA